MSSNSMHDLQVSHIDGGQQRRETAKPKEMRPLFSHEPLSHDREKRRAAQPQKKRKRLLPTTPALSFDPKCNHIPSGRQDPPTTPPVYSRTSTSESSTSSHDEQQTTPFANCEIHEQFYSGYDAQKRPRIFPECSSTEHPTSFHPDRPCADVSDMSSAPPDFYDSPVSCASSSSPDPSDQSPRVAELPVPVIDYVRPVQPMYPYSGQVYVPQLVVHQDPYGCPMGTFPDRTAPNYPVQYSHAAYGRPTPHGIPAYQESDYPYSRY